MRVPRRNPDPLNTAPLPGNRTPVGGPRLVVEQPDIRGVTATVAKAIEEGRERADRTLLVDADNRLGSLELDVRRQAEARKGKDALGAAEDAEQLWRQGVGEIARTLTNSRQLAMFQERASQRALALRAAVERHTTGEWERFQDDTFRTAVDLRLNDALGNYTDGQAVSKAALETMGLVEERGKQLGWDDTVTEARQAEAVSRIHTAVIARHIDTGNDIAAANWYQKAKTAGQVTGADQAKIDTALEQASTLGQAQRNADRIMAAEGVNRTAAYAEAAKITDPKQRKATEQQLDEMFQRRERAEKEQDDARTERAAAYVERGERVPPSLWSQLRPGVRTGLDARRRAVLRGDLIQTDPVAWYELRRMAVEDPQKFAALNLIEYRGKLSNQDFEQMGNLQAGVLKKGGEAVRGILTDDEIVNQVVGPLFPRAGRAGDKDDTRARAEALREVDAIIVGEKRATNKEQLPAERVREIADAWALRRAFIRGENPLGIEEDGLGDPRMPTERIPGADRTKLVTYLRRHGFSVRTSKIERLYAASRLGLPQEAFERIAREP